MLRWIPYPFLRITLFLVAGILVTIHYGEAIPEYSALLFAALGLLVYIPAAITKRKFVINPGAIALPAVFACGCLLVIYRTASRYEGHISHFEAIISYKGVVTAAVEQRERTWKTIVEVRSAMRDGQWKPAHGKVLVYVYRDPQTSTPPVRYGDIVLFKGAPSRLQPPANPGEFDYRRYLEYQNIFSQHFVRLNDIRILGESTPSFILSYSLAVRAWANGIIHQHVRAPREQAVAAALVLGVTSEVDHDLLDAYSASGAMHVLAVSGLHISILYLIIATVLKPLSRTRKGAWIMACVSLVILWSYAFVTGLSPSVLRAVTMFTFIAVGNASSRATNIYNTLAASAFCLLIYDPFLITSVGFQLSYAAVAGIVCIHPWLYDRLEFDSWFLNEAWKITSVTLAAQAATFPLGLFYFHQFPTYFLFSNLLVIPISFAVLVLGLFLLAIAAVPYVNVATGWLLETSVKLLNGCVVIIDGLPFSVVSHVRISAVQAFLLTGIVIVALLLVQLKKFAYFRILCVLTVLFALCDWYYLASSNDEKMIIYNVRGHSALDICADGMAYFFADSVLGADPRKQRLHIEPHRILMDADDVADAASLPISRKLEGGTLIAWRHLVILIITGNRFNPRTTPPVDVVVIANNAVRDVDKLTHLYAGAVFVFDSSNTFAYAKRMVARVEAARAHSVLHDGPFELTIDHP